MKFSALVSAVGVAALIFTSAAPAAAGSKYHGKRHGGPKIHKFAKPNHARHGYRRGYRHGYWHGHRRHSNHGVWVGGAVGLATGLIIGTALTRPRYVAPPTPVYYGPPRPWTRAWYRYCIKRYRSFNPRTGYYVTYSGYRRFCR